MLSRRSSSLRLHDMRLTRTVRVVLVTLLWIGASARSSAEQILVDSFTQLPTVLAPGHLAGSTGTNSDGSSCRPGHIVHVLSGKADHESLSFAAVRKKEERKMNSWRTERQAS